MPTDSVTGRTADGATGCGLRGRGVTGDGAGTGTATFTAAGAAIASGGSITIARATSGRVMSFIGKSMAVPAHCNTTTCATTTPVANVAITLRGAPVAAHTEAVETVEIVERVEMDGFMAVDNNSTFQPRDAPTPRAPTKSQIRSLKTSP